MIRINRFFYIILFLFFTVSLYGYPQRSSADIKIQHSLTESINKDPNNADLRFELAMEYAATGWVELGWHQLSQVDQLDKNYKQVVMDTYSKRIRSHPNDWKAHFRLAFAHYFFNDKNAAIESFKTVLTIDPNNVWSMGYISLIYGDQKNHKQCIRWAKKALSINDDALAIHFLLAKAYQETGNYFSFIGESIRVVGLKSIEAKYRPIAPIDINQ